MPIGVQKIEPLSSSEKKWQAIENLVHILLERTLILLGESNEIKNILVCNRIKAIKGD